MDSGRVSICAVGDVCINRDQPETIFALSSTPFEQADVSFCQLEQNLSERGSVLPQARMPMRAHPRNVAGLKHVGFTVVSCAGNHCLDFGSEALFDTIDVLKRNGMLVVGAGKDIMEARKPAIVEKNGVKLAFLAYNSILPPGYWATNDRPGCVPMRGLTLYEQIETDQPGTPCRVFSFAHPEDLARMKEDISKAKQEADLVIVSQHWGLHFIQAELAAYQREVGYAAIDSGADLILGHHAHILKGIEVYQGKVIFHSLGNFAFDQSIPLSIWNSPRMQEVLTLNPDWKRDPEYPGYHFPTDSRKTILVKCQVAGKRIVRVSFLPALINGKSQPEILPRKDQRSAEVFSYMEKMCRDIGTTISWDGDEILVAI